MGEVEGYSIDPFAPKDFDILNCLQSFPKAIA